ncbi:hypothetical protein ACE1SV_42080 [Streptomyces sennicomposti]
MAISVGGACFRGLLGGEAGELGTVAGVDPRTPSCGPCGAVLALLCAAGLYGGEAGGYGLLDVASHGRPRGGRACG